MPMTDDDKQKLQSSKDAVETKRAALAAAKSDTPADIALLASLLPTLPFLNRLDSPKEYEGTYTDLRIAQVVQTLAANRRPAADAALLSLIDAKDYQAHVLRMQILIHALAVIKPSPPKAVTYWDAMSQPKSPIAYDVIEALVENQSPPAMALFEKKIADPRHALDSKAVWYHRIVLPRRNDEPLLTASDHLMQNPAVTPDVKLAIVESLFDYKPASWYRGCTVPKPPARNDATPAAKKLCLRIAETATTSITLPSDLKALVDAAIRELKAGGA